jgi:hypothetical protein
VPLDAKAMETSTFDPTRSVVFDLNRGQVTLEGNAPMLLLGAESLAQLCAQVDVAVLRQFGVALGKQAGSRIRARLSGNAAFTIDTMVDQLGGELSLAGLGSLSIERWGQALVVQIERCPLGRSAYELMSAYVEAALQVAVNREVNAVVLERGAQSFRLLLCSKAAAARVKGWITSGGSWGDALAALHHNPRNDGAGGHV